MNHQAVRIVIGDGQLLTRVGLRSLLDSKSHLDIVGEAAYADELIDLSSSSTPDVIILDYYQPPYFDIDDLEKLNRTYPQGKTLVITSELDRDKVLKALSHGVKGFLTKACDEQEVLGAIRSVAKGEKFFCSKVLDIILERELPPADNKNQREIDDEACEPIKLTQRELEIVNLMVQGMNAQEIAENLHLSVHTIYTHRKNIMRKLDVSSAAEVILYAINTKLLATN